MKTKPISEQLIEMVAKARKANLLKPSYDRMFSEIIKSIRLHEVRAEFANNKGKE